MRIFASACLSEPVPGDANYYSMNTKYIYLFLFNKRQFIIFEPSRKKTVFFFAYAKTKTHITAKLISAFVFATSIVHSLYFINPKFQASGNLLWLYSPICVGPSRKHRRPDFSQRGSFAGRYITGVTKTKSRNKITDLYEKSGNQKRARNDFYILNPNNVQHLAFPYGVRFVLL